MTSKDRSQALLRTSGEPWSPEAELLFYQHKEEYARKLDKKCHDLAIKDGVQQISDSHVSRAGDQIGLKVNRVSKLRKVLGIIGTTLFGIGINKLYLAIEAVDQEGKITSTDIAYPLGISLIGLSLAVLIFKD
ncbi:hypothetical protein [Roseivirga misakiensis]|uniref:Uncharacterized protein n=1 Tax=Roseivirga misakiensis TaxID=1563681 RepID=A0A1E5T4S4_9BACT|nr:hypothetical protein [Roseivirga misakiensis]OEK06361.1 hypothetical protein BFP71_01400 [Roseivirga misakiensis]